MYFNTKKYKYMTPKTEIIKKHSCKRCGCKQISIETDDGYVCFGCKYRFNMNYKVGDRVKVRWDLERQSYGCNSATSEMVQLRGRIVTISEARSDGQYRVREDEYGFNWTREMFEGSE